MAGDEFISENKKGKEFSEIILKHIERILEISTSELRQVTTVTTNSLGDKTEFKEDTRKSYIQSIEALAIILAPWFDEEMNKSWDEDGRIINYYNYELEEHFKEEFAKRLEETEGVSFDDDFYQDVRVYAAKCLFRELNLLLKRLNHFKGIDFGESE